MGLKSKLNKMKNFLFDEEEIEKPEKKKVKSKKTYEQKRETEKPKEVINNYEDDFYFDDISDKESENVTEVKSRMTKEIESEFKFPEFNDEDFMIPKKEEPKVEPVKKEEVKPILYQGSKRREETKKFKPSPIISPIYGILDNNGNTLKKDDKKGDSELSSNENMSFDEIRKKAYGAIDDEFESTMSRLSKKTIEEAEADMKKQDEEEKKVHYRSNEKSKSKVLYEKPIVVDTEDGDDDDMVLPSVNFKEIDMDEKCENKKEDKKVLVDDDDDEDTKEQDLFNLIDTIYSGEEKD